jgi:hypothetical protein
MSNIVRIVAVVCTAFAILTTAGGLSAANADPLIGKTYKDASATVSQWGSTPVIATVFGDRLATDECIVTTWQKSQRMIEGNRKSAVLINLYCNAAVAQAGSSGNSAASAEGKIARENIKTVAWCALPEQAGNDNCATFCSKHDGLCTGT